MIDFTKYKRNHKIELYCYIAGISTPKSTTIAMSNTLLIHSVVDHDGTSKISMDYIVVKFVCRAPEKTYHLGYIGI